MYPSNHQTVKILYACQSVICLLLTLTFPALLSATETPNQLVFNSTGQPPLNTKNGQGFIDEVIREVIQHTGYQLQIQILPAERALHSLNAGLIDGEMSRIKGLKTLYPNLIRVPEKIMDWEFVVFSKKPIDLSHGWQSLAGKNIAYITGWKILEKNIPDTAITTKVKNSEQLFKLLDRDRVDFIIYEHWGGQYLLKKLSSNNIHLRTPALIKKEMYIYLYKKHSNIIDKLSNALKQMKQDGRYQQLKDKHLSPYFNESTQ